MDYEQAMEYILENAEKWHVMKDRIAVVGFSAGGHLAGAAATMGRHRPAAAILGYPVLMQETALELGLSMPGIPENVDENTCPCFLFATRTDSVVPIQNTIDMLNALNRYQTSFECHIYGYGPHGFSTGDHSVQNCETPPSTAPAIAAALFAPNASSTTRFASMMEPTPIESA